MLGILDRGIRLIETMSRSRQSLQELMKRYHYTLKSIRLNEFVESTPFDVLYVRDDHGMYAFCAKH